jgi:tetratricopeptide (TPR) repeat protein
MLKKALVVYTAAFVAVAILAKAAIVGIGLPDWVFAGALIVMALGLPMILWTAYVHRVARRTVTATPTYTPGGTPSMQGTMATLAIKASPHVSWRRTTLGGVWALGGFAVLTGGYMTMRAFGIGPAGSLLASGKLDKRDAIVLADFRTTNTDSSLGRVVSEAVRQGLSESSVLTLKQPAEIGAALARMQRAPTAKLDSALARDIAVREGVKAILDGDVAGVGTSGYIVTLRLIRADSGVLLASVNAAGEGSQGLIDAADKAVRLLRGKAGESLRRVNGTAPLAAVTTSSLDALRKYSDAYKANSMDGDYAKAVALARQAVAIDPSFAMAWRLMGVSAANGNMSPALQDSAYERAYALRERLTTRERIWTTVNYFRSPRHRDRVKALAAADSGLALGTPLDSGVFGNYIGLDYSSRRDFRRAADAFALSANSSYQSSFPGTNRVIALVDAGEIAEAERAVKQGLEKFPTVPRVQQRTIEIYYHTGKLDELSRSLDSVARTGSPQMRAWASTLQSSLAVRSGRVRQKLRAATDSDAPDPDAPGSLLDINTEVVINMVLRDSAALAIRSLDAALKAQPIQAMADVERPYFELASSYAAAGRPDKARELLNQFTRDITDTAMNRVVQPRYHTALGEVLLAEKKFAEALTEFRRGDSLPDGPANSCAICLSNRLARTFEAAGQADSAIAMYNRYLTTPSWVRMQVDLDGTWLAPTHHRLAKLYDAKGDAPNAIIHYQALVNLWKDADPEFQPRVSAARGRISALGRR